MTPDMASRAKREIAAWDRRNPTLAKSLPEVYKSAVWPSRSAGFETDYKTWGIVALKFRYPGVPKRTREERAEYTRECRSWREQTMAECINT